MAAWADRRPLRRAALGAAMLVGLSAGLAGPARADEDPTRVPRLWGLKEEGEVTATFIRREGKEVVLALPDGAERRVELWRCNAKDLAYLQRQHCTLPAELRRPEPAPGDDPLVSISAAGLPDGPLRQWANRGRMGGAFHPLNTPPEAGDVAGRRAVTFTHSPWALPMEFQPMVADFHAPQSIQDGQAFTVAAWLYNPGAIDFRETVLAWQRLTGDDGTLIGYGAEGRYAHERKGNGGAYDGPLGGAGFPDAAFPEPNRWHHLAYVLAGGRQGDLRLYVDGRLAAVKKPGRILRNLPATDITRTAATIHADLFLRDDKPVNVWAYVGERDNHHWRWLRWRHKLDLGPKDSGMVSVPLGELEGGKRYYFRFLAVADDEERWSDGAGSFITAGADGKGGAAVPAGNDRLLFLGCDWGSIWDWAVKPVRFYTGSIAELRLYDRALSQREVRHLAGLGGAYGPSPADGAVLDTLNTRLTWQAGAEGAKGFRVYFGAGRDAVAAGAAGALRATPAEPAFDPGPLELGQTYWWRIDQIDANGTCGPPGEVWRFTAETGKAAAPSPADGDANASIYTCELHWTPGRHARRQNLYFGTDLDAVRAGTSRPPAAGLGPKVDKWRIPFDRKAAHGATYYWRVEQVNGEGLPAAPGDVWQYTVEDYFRPEADGPVPQPFPRDIRQDGYYGKYLACDGHPFISKRDCPDEALVLARRSCLKLMGKRPDAVSVMAAHNCAGHLSHGEKPWGWSEFTCACYGASRNMLLDPTFYWGQNMLIHEMGHQFHMFGAEPLEPDFRKRLQEVYLAAMKDLKWIGDYGSNNLWEYMAVAASAWVNDGDKDDIQYPRDRLRANDPRFYFFLNDYWPGDVRVELRPDAGLKADAQGGVAEWANRGGVEYWGKFGWAKYDGTVGAFRPVGRPRLATVKGVTAVAFGGGDALVWDGRASKELAGNHEWSVELWALAADPPARRGCLASWGAPGEGGAQVLWGAGEAAYDHGPGRTGRWAARPGAGKWRHIVHVFAGGGLADGPGQYRLYVDGRLDSAAGHKLSIAAGQPVVIGGRLEGGAVRDGFAGAIAHVRIYDYDLSEFQVRAHHAEERGCYERDDLAVAGSLLVDLDARFPAPCPADETWPLYPPGSGGRWLRSWANRGTLGGKCHNDVHEPAGSDPLVDTLAGRPAVAFQGNDRMVSSFSRPAWPEGRPVTVELWVCRRRYGGTLLQWGDVTVPADAAPAGAPAHVALVRDGGSATLYVDGEQRPWDPHGGPRAGADATPAPSPSPRLHLGAAWDGQAWGSYFHGAMERVRIHAGALTAEEVRRNAQAGHWSRPATPPPEGGAGGRAARGQPLIDLDAAALPEGKLRSWPNAGRAGGVFAAGKPGEPAGGPAEPAEPVVQTVAGRRAVTFDGRGGFLTSDVPTPPGVTLDRPFTVEAWVHNPQTAARETVFSLAPLVAMESFPDAVCRRALECGYGGGGQDSASALHVGWRSRDVGWPGGPPEAGRWHHLAWVYEGGRRSELRVYVDGELRARRTHYALYTMPGQAMRVGASWHTGTGADSMLSGSLASLRVYDHARGDREIRAAATGAGAGAEGRPASPGNAAGAEDGRHPRRL